MDAAATDGNLIAGAILAGFGAVAAAIKLGLRSYAQSFRDMSVACKAVAEKMVSQGELLIKLEAVVDEGRDDIREIRDMATRHFGGDRMLESESKRRPRRTPVTGVPQPPRRTTEGDS